MLRGALKRDRERVLRQAWIGDAVLCLWARGKVLREGGAVDGDRAARLTSNRFLAAFGEPSEVEAAIGAEYESGGLAAAFAWIDARLAPVFERQEANRAGKPRP